MSIFEAILLGIIQGLTEFLPVSSSGHLELAKVLFNTDLDPDKSMMLTVVLHLATSLSTIVIFRKEIQKLIIGGVDKQLNEDNLYIFKIVLSMVPAAIVGVVYKDEIESLFAGNVLLVGSMLILTGILLFIADKAKNTTKDVDFKSALIVGISQAIAILPGISRSGATISTSVILGVDREKAARFSFLMVVPLIFGAMAKDILDDGLDLSGDIMLPLIAGFVVAFVTGMFACKWMINLVKNSQLKYFAFYCFIVGATSIIYTIL